MRELPFFSSEQERAVAVLGKTQLREYLEGRQVRSAFCVMSQERLYWGGYHFFQNYVGDWTGSAQPSSEAIADITEIAYRKQNDPTRARRTAIRLSVLVFALAALSALMSLNRMGGFNSLFFLLLPFPISLALSAAALLKSRKSVMLEISFGCETLSVRTSWYSKEELDAFHNRLVQSTSETHVKEDVLSGMDMGKTYGGRKIIAEFGGQYRERYLKDRKCPYGFCTITPGELHLGGAYSWRFLPGIWLRSRKIRDIRIDQVSKVYYGIVRKPFTVLWAYPLVLLCLLTAARGIGLISITLISAGIALLPVLPFWAVVLFRQKRLIIESRQGTFAFWTHQDRKAEIRRFQKILLGLIERRSDGQEQEEAVPPIVSGEPAVKDPAAVSWREGAELLREYHKLLREGIIDQAEFDRVKGEILLKQP